MSRTFVIAEAGSNFRAKPRNDTADFVRARALIDVAADAGADACKFQFWSDSAKVYVPGAGPAGYLAARGDRRDVGAIFDDLRLPAEWLPKLANHCGAHGIEFMASVFHPDDVPIVDPYVRRHKIASYEMGYEALVRACAKTGKPLIVSTGAHSDDRVHYDAPSEIERAVEWAHESGCKDLTLMQCCACYPAPPEAIELCAIQRLWFSGPEVIRLCAAHAGRRSSHNVSAGYSDHSAEWWTPIAAVALGATVIEKHFTLNRKLAGPDHAFALEPDDLRQMVRAIRQAEVMLGDGAKRIEPAEQELRRFAVRHVQALRDLVPGDPVIENETVACLRPGNRPPGAWAGDLTRMCGKQLRRAVAAGDGVCMEDVE